RLRVYLMGLGRYGIVIGASLVIGVAIITIGLSLPPGAQPPFWIVGGVLGPFGCLSAPVWCLLAGLRLRTGLISQT
ncbi:MAG: hypothetical protein LH616_11175, partial [Ilumatobacteraceae bacterium]|nr:hypothetical protein [Ilumatobacteraceae bacterium]